MEALERCVLIIKRLRCAGLAGATMATMEFYTWDEMEKEVLSDTIARKMVRGDKAMVAQVFLAKGAVVPEHLHESEQITYILDGALEFELEGKEVVVRKGQVLRDPFQRAASRGGARGYARSGHFQPHSPRLAQQEDDYLRRK